MKHRVEQLGEVWMYLRDPKKLARLMVIQDVSQRELARAAGWKSHSYMGRLINGTARTCDTEPALRIAHKLGVAVDDLFLTKISKNVGSRSPARESVPA